MATPTFSSVTTGTSTGTVLSLAVAHTVAGGLTNAGMYIMVDSTTSRQVDTCDWNGTIATNIGNRPTGSFFRDIYFVPGPASGTHNVNLTWTAFSANIMVTIITVNNSGSPVVHDTPGFTGGGTTASDTTSTTKDNSLVLSVCATDNSVTQTQAGGQTQESNFTAQNATYRQSTSYKAVAVAGSNTMSVTVSATTTDYIMSSIVIPPPALGAGNMFLVF